jgi:PAS domain S-box-containing protein
MIIVDLQQRDNPIIYASEAFSVLTGYSNQEILGRNCRFLQSPPGRVPKASSEQRAAIRQMRHAVRENLECQVTVANYRKNGTRFLNYLTMIPVAWNSRDGSFNYSIGLQIEVQE